MESDKITAEPMITTPTEPVYAGPVTPPQPKPENLEIASIVDKEVIDLEEKRRRECIGNMEKIEKEFLDLKEKFFTEKIESLKREHEEIKNGMYLQSHSLISK
jgi:hypothetical protein